MGRRGRERQKEEKRIVMQALAMVMQFGLNMIVPICMTTALGVWLDRRFGTSWLTVALFAVGAVAGGQNIYRMARAFWSDEDAGEENGGAPEDPESADTAGDKALK